MMSRKLKYMMLAAAGGLLLQAGGCGQLVIDLLISNVLPLILSELVGGALAGATT